ncbi:MAG TPA: zf-HC2 domain-containing protein [Bryobacteraceae bacterium]|nr:zf-HC2 domain-containing protein [Bryobacteraceae bacterium]
MMNCTEVVELVPLYLADALDPRRAAEVVAHLHACSSCARFTETDSRLRGAMLAEPVDTANVDNHVRRRIGASVRFRRLTIGAGIAAALMLALFVYRNFGGADPVYAAAALDHRREVVEHARRVWVSDPDAIAALAAREGIAPASIQAFSIAGYRLEQAKRCRLNGLIFLHLVYADGSHEISVFLRQPGSDRRHAVETAEVGQECVGAFENGHVSGFVVVEQSRQRATELARYASSVL